MTPFKIFQRERKRSPLRDDAHPNEQDRSSGTPISRDKTAAKTGHPIYCRIRR